jgi:hypothetical protein
VLLVAGSNGGDAAIVLPQYDDSTLSDAPTTDSALHAGTRVDLFARSGLVGSATIAPAAAGSYSGGCTAWPAAHLMVPAGPPPAWSIAFLSGHAMALPMDSMADLSPRDSSRRAIAVDRVASALPDDTVAEFRGTPFVVDDAHRFVIPPRQGPTQGPTQGSDTIEVVAAELVRRLNTEANPREEHLLLIVEGGPPSGASGRAQAYVPAYWDRVSGAEDEVESSEVMAGVLLGSGRTPAIIVGRDDGDGGSYTLLVRDAPHHWRVRWNSAYTGC